MLYIIHAFRYGNHENHSYLVGVFTDKETALKEADTEEDYRGGKYECEVTEWEVDKSLDKRYDGKRGYSPTLIKKLLYQGK